LEDKEYLESDLEIQPIYNYAERRIEAHIFLCFLAMLLEWELARRLKEIDDKISVHEVIDDLCQVKTVKLRYEEAEFLVRTELKGKVYLAFKAVTIRVPPRVLEPNVVPTSSFTLKGVHRRRIFEKQLSKYTYTLRGLNYLFDITKPCFTASFNFPFNNISQITRITGFAFCTMTEVYSTLPKCSFFVFHFLYRRCLA